MNRLFTSVLLVLLIPSSALSTQHSALDKEFELIRRVAAGEGVGADAAAENAKVSIVASNTGRSIP